MQRGIAAVTCGGPAEDSFGAPIPPTNSFTFGLFDLRNPTAAMYGPCNTAPYPSFTVPLWNAPMHKHPSWTVENLGNLYGITLDKNGNIYVAAHGLYGTFRPLHHRYGNLGGGPTSLVAAGTVYRIDAITGAATVFAVIPGQQAIVINSSFTSGPGLGNIAYDEAYNQFFVSSLEDGKIYRLDATGAILNSFDPLAPDDGAPGMPPRSERVWAVEVSNGAVFYSIWNDGNSSSPGVIRRVALTGTGDFDVGTDAAVLTVPPQTWVPSGGAPVSDITFSLDGQTMIIGARTMATDTTAYNHMSATHKAVLVGTTWTVVGTKATGCNSGAGEGYGGVALGEETGVQEAIVWTSSADMGDNFGPHGLFGVRMVDFPISGKAVNSFKVPYDPVYLNEFRDDRKGSGGDIEIMRTQAKCMAITAREVRCPETNGGPFTVLLDITNLTTNTIHYVWFTPCLTSSLPAGAITAQPEPSGIIMLPTPLSPNASTTIVVTLPPNVGGETVCFRVTLLDRQGNHCCTDKVCVVVPPCDCAEVLDTHVDCEMQSDGTIQYTITLTIANLTHLSANPYGFTYVSFLPPIGFSPSFAIPTPNPIPPGGTGTVQATYYGTPGTICFNVGLHDETLEECCSPKEICIDLPDCPPGSDKPDTCIVETKVPCCPPTDGTAGPPFATVNYTVCNNSTVPRTYTWSADGVANPLCSNMLTSTSFSPPGGTLGPIPPGGCMTVAITIRCEGFAPGECAAFRICARYNDTVPPLCCEGIIYKPKQGEPVVKTVSADGKGYEISVGSIVPLTFEVENPTDSPMTVNLLLRDSISILALSQDREPPSPFLFTTMMLAPSETQQLVVDAGRWDDGAGAPNFTSVEIWAGAEGSPGFGEPVLTVPVRLLPVTTEPAFAVKDVRVESAPTAQIILSISTVIGRRYKVEQTRDLTGPWSLSECTSPDAEIDPTGFLRGTGDDIAIHIECDPSASRTFFRAVEHR